MLLYTRKVLVKYSKKRKSDVADWNFFNFLIFEVHVKLTQLLSLSLGALMVVPVFAMQPEEAAAAVADTGAGVFAAAPSLFAQTKDAVANAAKSASEAAILAKNTTVAATSSAASSARNKVASAASSFGSSVKSAANTLATMAKHPHATFIVAKDAALTRGYAGVDTVAAKLKAANWTKSSNMISNHRGAVLTVAVAAVAAVAGYILYEILKPAPKKQQSQRFARA